MMRRIMMLLAVVALMMVMLAMAASSAMAFRDPPPPSAGEPGLSGAPPFGATILHCGPFFSAEDMHGVIVSNSTGQANHCVSAPPQ
jgi:hypothetical protein